MEPAWNQLCSSLDKIEDTALAINAYSAVDVAAQKRDRDYGSRYLALYGLMQALFLQQDATTHLCEALDVPFDLQNYPRLVAIRDVRNASIGHPTKRGSTSHRSHNFISRVSLENGRFTLMSAYPHGTHGFDHVDVGAFIAHQREDVGRALSTVVAELDRRAEEHRTKFMNERLAKAFSEEIGYALEKLGEALRGSKPLEMGVWAIETAEQAMNEFVDGLTQKGMELDTFDSVKQVYGELGYALPELKNYHQSQKSDILNDRMARIVAFFIVHSVNELRDHGREIDDSDVDCS